MADPTPPTPPSPQKAAKGLAGVFKGKPAWVWVAGITVLLGVAYFTFSRRNVEDPGTGDNLDTQADDGQMAVGDYGGYYPVASEGAYGGYDQPQDYAPVPVDNAGTPEPMPGSPITVNVSYPAPTGGGKPAAVGAPAHAPVAGGAKRFDGHPLAWWQNPAHARKRVKVKGKWVYRWRWPGGGGYKHTRAFAGRA